MSNKTNKDSDIQGLVRLITDATIGITALVEAMHQRILYPPFLPSTPIQHLLSKIASFTYHNIKWSTKQIGNGLDKILSPLHPMIREKGTSIEQETIRAVLNGVIGDYLDKTNNPLKIEMQLKHQEESLDLEAESPFASLNHITGNLILMIHGSCMNDLQWTRKEHNHGKAISKDLNSTVLYLHYNTGRHISTNGKALNLLLERLVQQWPVQIKSIKIIAHSMGGLVSRSACYYGQTDQKTWPSLVKKMVFLGSPHHGAPLERLGNYLDHILEAIPYAKPFARLGKIRSAGVTDLRFGNLIDEDWQNEDRFKNIHDQRKDIPLPQGIECFAIAAVLGKHNNLKSSSLIGDGLVHVNSALGKHKKSYKTLTFKEENIWIAYEQNHLDLLSHPETYDKIKTWLLDA